MLITESLSISNSTSREDNSSPLMSWKSPPYYGVSAFFRGVRKSWEAPLPPSSDGRAPSDSREDGGRGGSTSGCIPAPSRGMPAAGGTGARAPRGEAGCLPPAKGARGPAGGDSSLRSPSHPSKGSLSPLSLAAGISCYRKSKQQRLTS